MLTLIGQTNNRVRTIGNDAKHRERAICPNTNTASPAHPLMASRLSS